MSELCIFFKYTKYHLVGAEVRNQKWHLRGGRRHLYGGNKSLDISNIQYKPFIKNSRSCLTQYVADKKKG